MHIALIHPEIPQNTGNIARTCAATGTELHLVKPLGFELSDKYLKRAGLDYWNLMTLTVHESTQEFFRKYADARMYFATTKARHGYADVQYAPDDFLVFGRETRGLPETLIAENYDRSIRIPMRVQARSLNLSNSVAVILYEALRRTGETTSDALLRTAPPKICRHSSHGFGARAARCGSLVKSRKPCYTGFLGGGKVAEDLYPQGGRGKAAEVPDFCGHV